MNTDRKAEWVAALRSGDYKQGQGRLAVITLDEQIRYCCLGVACELARKARVGVIRKSDSFGITYDDHNVSLPPSVRKWLDIDFYDPAVIPGINTLASLNDEGTSFEEIANIIEEQL